MKPYLKWGGELGVSMVTDKRIGNYDDKASVLLWRRISKTGLLSSIRKVSSSWMEGGLKAWALTWPWGQKFNFPFPLEEEEVDQMTSRN